MSATKTVLIACLVLCARSATAQSSEKEAAIVEIGAAPSWNVTSGGASLGPTVAVEVTPIENWLELEAGVTALFARHSTEWDTDLLFKKPWTLSKKAEFMAGVGPEWIRARNHGVKTDSVSAEGVLDFMFWPWAKRRFGWYVEPSYEYNFGPGREQSLGVSGGLLIAIR